MNSQEYAKGLMHGHSVWMHDFSFIFLPKSYHMTSEEVLQHTRYVDYFKYTNVFCNFDASIPAHCNSMKKNLENSHFVFVFIERKSQTGLEQDKEISEFIFSVDKQQNRHTCCNSAFRQLRSAKEGFTEASLGLLANQRRRQLLTGLLKSLRTIKTLVITSSTLLMAKQRVSVLCAC